ncbi:MAG: GDP-mannose 4,6-dehydratase, partial [Anaerolineales bacterium]|nr:GDP-mannose 4,6-dehydratase [Anaerolineales bacterium]
MRNYLVTGGAGFIGSHLVQALLAGGNAVRVLDNFSTGRRENLEVFDGRLEVQEGDLRDAARVGEAVRDVEVIFHEAAFVSAPLSISEPRTCFDVNVGGTEILLEAARQAHVRRVVLASSAAVYGNSDALPLAEDARLQPLSPYAASKQIAEIYAGLYTRAFGLEVVALRYFNVAGSAADGSLGEDHDPETHLIPVLLLAALGRREKVTVFGADYPTPDGTCIRDNDP